MHLRKLDERIDQIAYQFIRFSEVNATSVGRHPPLDHLEYVLFVARKDPEIAHKLRQALVKAQALVYQAEAAGVQILAPRAITITMMTPP